MQELAYQGLLPSGEVPPGVQVHPRLSWRRIAHLPAGNRVYLGSPSLVRLPDGALVVSLDHFGPGTGNDTSRVYRSEDDGMSWCQVAEIRGQWWSTVFLHGDALHLLGTTREYGDLVARRSQDGGRTWSEPVGPEQGRLRTDARYHCGPQPMLIHRGRIWRAVEDLHGGHEWGRCFRAGMLSAPADADLLRAEAWTLSDMLPSAPGWLDGRCNGWLEGNAVAAADGGLVDILRVDLHAGPEVAAVVRCDDEGRRLAFDPASGFIPFPGGAKKFSIRADPRGGCWWSVVSPADRADPAKPADQRNRLALALSTDLVTWREVATLVSHPDRLRHGFQYVDWVFDGDDILAVCRTAAGDGCGGAANFHDANQVTFHRLSSFRRLAAGG